MKETPPSVFGPPPSGLIYWGNTALLGFIGLLIGLASWITYPEIIWAEVEVFAGDLPVDVVASSSGRIMKIWVSEDQTVESERPLLLLESEADWEAVSELEKQSEPDWQELDPSRLGSLAKPLIAWQQERELHQEFLQHNNIPQRIVILENQVQQLFQLNSSLEQQKQTLQTIIEISLSNVARQKELIERGAASFIDLESAQSEYLQLKRQQETINLSIIDNQIQQEQLKLEQMRLQQKEAEDKERFQSRLRALRKEIAQQLTDWKQKYVLTAPLAGQVTFSAPLQEGQFVSASEVLMTLIPKSDGSSFSARGTVGPKNIGKIKPGKQAYIRLDGFPYEQYGQIPAQVRSISVLPHAGRYRLELDLPKGGKSTYKQILPLRSKLSGMARIILEDRSLLDRIWSQMSGWTD